MASRTAASIRLMPCQHRSPPAAVDSSETLPERFGTRPAEVQKRRGVGDGGGTKQRVTKGHNWTTRFQHMYEISHLQSSFSQDTNREARHKEPTRTYRENTNNNQLSQIIKMIEV